MKTLVNGIYFLGFVASYNGIYLLGDMGQVDDPERSPYDDNREVWRSWQRACFGSKKPQVQVLSPRPAAKSAHTQENPRGNAGVFLLRAWEGTIVLSAV